MLHRPIVCNQNDVKLWKTVDTLTKTHQHTAVIVKRHQKGGLFYDAMWQYTTMVVVNRTIGYRQQHKVMIQPLFKHYIAITVVRNPNSKHAA